MTHSRWGGRDYDVRSIIFWIKNGKGNPWVLEWGENPIKIYVGGGKDGVLFVSFNQHEVEVSNFNLRMVETIGDFSIFDKNDMNFET